MDPAGVINIPQSALQPHIDFLGDRYQAAVGQQAQAPGSFQLHSLAYVGADVTVTLQGRDIQYTHTHTHNSTAIHCTDMQVDRGCSGESSATYMEITR